MSHAHPPTPEVPTLAPAALREPDAARYIARSRAFLKKARIYGRGPSFVRVHRSISYRVTDLDRWLETHLVRTCE